MPHKVRLHPAAERLVMENGLLRDEAAHLLAAAAEEAPAPVELSPEALTRLRAEQALLEAQVEQLTRRVAEVQMQPPFALREQLQDDAWVATRRAEIEARLAALNTEQVEMEQRLVSLLPDRL